MASQALYLVDVLMGAWSELHIASLLSSFVAAFKREEWWVRLYASHIFWAEKWGGDNSYAVPPRRKVGGRVPPSPTDRRPWSHVHWTDHHFCVHNCARLADPVGRIGVERHETAGGVWWPYSHVVPEPVIPHPALELLVFVLRCKHLVFLQQVARCFSHDPPDAHDFVLLLFVADVKVVGFHVDDATCIQLRLYAQAVSRVRLRGNGVQLVEAEPEVAGDVTEANLVVVPRAIEGDVKWRGSTLDHNVLGDGAEHRERRLSRF